MTRHTSLDMRWAKGTWIALCTVVLSSSGCAGEDPAPAPRQVGQASEEFHWLRLCGGFRDVECGHHSVCLPLVPRGCPGHRRIGVCAPRPHWCPSVARPVCGCDGVTYANLCEAARAGTPIEHRGACSESGEPVCGGAAGSECAGASVCVDDPADTCTPGDGADCPGICECTTIEQCPRGEVWDDDPTVCGCVPESADPCARITCPTGTQCVVAPDGSATCEAGP